MKKTVLIVIRVVCIVGFLVCVGVLGWYFREELPALMTRIFIVRFLSHMKYCNFRKTTVL